MVATTKTAARKGSGATKSAKKSAPKQPAGTDQPAATVTRDDRIGEAVGTVARFARDGAHASIGAGFVVQGRLAERKFEFIGYRTFLEEAKAEGQARVNDLQEFVEPAMTQFSELVEPIADRIENRLPAPVRDALADGRERVRELLTV